MKKVLDLIPVMIVLLLIPVFAEGYVFAADDDVTTYSVFIYSGKEGYFGEPGETLKRIDNIRYGTRITIDPADYGLTVIDPKSYYVRGLKIAGHDNDQLSSMQLKSYTLEVKEDVSFSVAYGMAGGMVKYTVKYQDREGNTLRESEDFYGMPGDKPVVSYRMIKGYLPDDYNLAKTIRDDESKNIFVFTYHKTGGDGTDGDAAGDDDGNGGAGSEDTGNGDGGGNGSAGNGAAGVNTGWEPAEGSDDTDEISDDDSDDTGITDLDDQEGPLSGGDTEKAHGTGLSAGAVVGLTGGCVILALLILFLLRRRRKDQAD